MNNDNSYFFLANGDLISQRKEQAFGVVDEHKFQLTALFDSSLPNMAYAICKGQVFILPQQGKESDTVNLVLKPYIQPLTGTKIKYFIYRGLQRADFFTAGQSPLVIAADSSDFVSSINRSFANLYQGTELPPFKAEYIGFELGFQSDNLLSSIFFKTSVLSSDNNIITESDAYELPMIDIGKSLGRFKQGECGIDVVLDYGDFENPQDESLFRLDLTYAGAQKAMIDLSGMTNDYKKKLKREQIAQFLDIAAFYGSQVNQGHVNSVLGERKGTAIYENLLQQFFTKNKVYVYIQSDRGRSYDFYKNYTISPAANTSIFKGEIENNLTESAYQTLGWPLLIDDQFQNHDLLENKLLLRFPIDYNNHVGCYVQSGKLQSSAMDGLMVRQELSEQTAPGAVRSDYTKPVVLLHPNVGPSGSKIPIATFDRLLYQGKKINYLRLEELGLETALSGSLDDIFDQLNATVVLKASEENVNSTLAIHKLKLVSPYYNKDQKGTWATQTVVVKDRLDFSNDVYRVTYRAEAIEARHSVIDSGGAWVDTRTSASTLQPAGSGDLNKTNAERSFDLVYFSDNQLKIPGLIPVSSDGKAAPHMQIGLVKSENDRVLEAIVSSGLQNVQLVLLDLHGAGNQFISEEKIAYKKYRLALSGENAEGQPALFQIEQDITIYTVDQYTYFSFLYASSINDLYGMLETRNSYVTFKIN
ncbi:hypothetical protein [Sphingobacterium detergens]